MEIYHTPVLLNKVIDYLQAGKGNKYIDATIGGGGHTEAILGCGGKVLGIDCDPEAIEYVKKILRDKDIRILGEKDDKSLNISVSQYPDITLIRGNFRDLKTIALSNDFENVSGILFDLGVSTHQLKTVRRGFSFLADTPLDMRMDPNLAVTAADLVNGLSKGELYELFSRLGEEYDARIARAIVRTRTIKPIKTCQDLAGLIIQIKGGGRGKKIHPATQVFQALRIAVNGELDNLRVALPQAVELLKRGGRLIVISFHSLEDRIVKEFFKNQPGLTILTEHPIRPDSEEIRSNPQSKSAKMRVAERN